MITWSTFGKHKNSFWNCPEIFVLLSLKWNVLLLKFWLGFNTWNWTMHVYCFILRQANGTHQGYKPHDYDWREMVSHVPFLDLNTVKKDKRITISQFILCVLLFFMRFRLPVQNAFKDSCQHSTTEPGQKQRLPFYDNSLVVKKKMFFFRIL